MARGRPRKIDRDQALEAALTLFWERGFDATSMADLCRATGMAKPGLYAAFGDKEALFSKALTRYFEARAEPMIADLVESPDPLDVAVRRFLVRAAETAQSASLPGGCFITNSLVGGAPHCSSGWEELARNFDRHRRMAFRARFQAAKAAGVLLDAADAEALGDYFSGQAVALAVMARAGASKDDLDRFISVAMGALATHLAT